MDLLKLVKSMLNISETDTSNDEYLNNLIAFATSFFTNITGQVLTENTEIEETFTKQYGVSIFKISKVPVTSLNKVIVDGQELDISNFYINDRFIISETPINGEKVTISVNVGYETIPSDIQYIIASICEYLYKQDSHSNYFTGDKAFTPSMNVIPGYIREMVQGYVY